MLQSFTSAALALAAATLAQADNTPYVVPEDAQIGLLHFPVTCQLINSLNQTFETIFTATAPVFGGTGQEIYYTDVVGTIVIPSYITNLAPLVNAKQASADITANLKLTNASPTNLQVYKDTIRNITFPFNGEARVRIPPGNGTLPALGPVTLGPANTAHRIFLGDIDVTINLQDANGGSVFTSIPVHCGQQDVDYVLGSVDINSTTGLAPFSPANGFVPSFPDTPIYYESGAFRFDYPCNFGSLGEQVVDLSIGGTIGAVFKPGEQFYLTNSESFLRVPPSLVTLAKQAYPNVTTFDTTVSEFDILFANAQPQSFNVAQTPIQSSIDVSGSTSDIVIPIPKTGNLKVGPITAGANGLIVAVGVGNATASTVLRDASGAALLTLPITCSPPAPLELIGVPITTQTTGNYSLGQAQSASSSAPAGTATATSAAPASSGFSLPSFGS